MLRRLLSIALSAALIFSALFVISGGGWHRAVDRAWMATRHLNQGLHYGFGYQLPGTPDLNRLDERLAAKGLRRGDPIFLRIFKSEMRLEIWMKRGARFQLFETYPICYWSGRLGPELRTGDRQAPEGFYTVAKAQLNPNSQWHRSFNLGFPRTNAEVAGSVWKPACTKGPSWLRKWTWNGASNVPSPKVPEKQCRTAVAWFSMQSRRQPDAKVVSTTCFTTASDWLAVWQPCRIAAAATAMTMQTFFMSSLCAASSM